MEVETASRTIRFKLNGQACSIASNPVTRTSDVLREELGLTGTNVGCDAGDCGACTILIDGEQRFACLTAAGQLEGCDVQTVEGLARMANSVRSNRLFTVTARPSVEYVPQAC